MIHAGIDQIRAAADALTSTTPTEAMTLVRDAYRLLTTEVEPHENAEETELYPVVNRLVGGDDPTAPMSRIGRRADHRGRSCTGGSPGS